MDTQTFLKKLRYWEEQINTVYNSGAPRSLWLTYIREYERLLSSDPQLPLNPLLALRAPATAGRSLAQSISHPYDS